MNIDNTGQKLIKIWFSDMWEGFDFQENYFTIHLSRNFNIELNPDPEFLIHSVHGKHYLNYNCYRICFTGENIRPDFSRSDFHIGFDYLDSPVYLRWPLFLMGRYLPEYLLQEKDTEAIFAQKKRFCSFIVSNGEGAERIEFFKRLNEYKKVDSGGRFSNNIGSPVVDKLAYLKESKFNIAYENVSGTGYTTEKIFDAFLSNCIPIYWGNPRISEDFNENAFINVHAFQSTEELISYIQHLDENDAAYKSMLGESSFPGNKIPKHFQVETFISFFSYIFEEAMNKKPAYKFVNRLEYLSYKTNRNCMALKRKVKFIISQLWQPV